MFGRRGWLADIARFVVRPTFAATPVPWGREAVWALVAVAAGHVAVCAAILWPLAQWGRAAGFLPAPVPRDMTVLATLFSFVVVAPLTEELLFRGWLSGRLAALRFGLYGAAALAVLLASFAFDPAERGPLAIAAVALVFAGLCHWGLTRQRDQQVPGWFIGHFAAMVWGSSLLFGLVHLGNYAGLSNPAGLMVVVPQTIGGLLLAYVRTRIGLLAAILYHAGYNGLFVAVELASG
jgi:membrane protease YdiL (CAAX protease family)